MNLLFYGPTRKSNTYLPGYLRMYVRGTMASYLQVPDCSYAQRAFMRNKGSSLNTHVFSGGRQSLNTDPAHSLGRKTALSSSAPPFCQASEVTWQNTSARGQVTRPVAAINCSWWLSRVHCLLHTILHREFFIYIYITPIYSTVLTNKVRS